jgi:hypothetical protein
MQIRKRVFAARAEVCGWVMSDLAKNAPDGYVSEIPLIMKSFTPYYMHKSIKFMFFLDIEAAISYRLPQRNSVIPHLACLWKLNEV